MDAITQAFISAHKPVSQEVQTDLPIIEGELPPDLRGVLFRIGPGRFSIGDKTYGHLFDGDGMVTRFAIGSASGDSRPRIRYRNRYVRTREFVTEEHAGRILYRGFGTNLPGGVWANFLRLNIKNAANTNIVYLGRSSGSLGAPAGPTGRLLALWEGGLPHRLDPVTLDTLERYDFGGQLLNRGPWLERMLTPELPFSAHPRRDLETGDIYNFGILLHPKPRLFIYQVTGHVAGLEPTLRVVREVMLPHAAFVHDFALTPHWFIFFICPVAIHTRRVLLGLTTLAEGIQPLAPAGMPTRILLVPRAGGEPRWQEASPGFIFHFANALEDETGRIWVDGFRQLEYPKAPPLKETLAGRLMAGARAYLTRYIIDPQAGASARVVETQLSAYASEYPSINPLHNGRPYRYIWASGIKPASETAAAHNVHTVIMRHDTVAGTTLVRDLSSGAEGAQGTIEATGARPVLPSEPIMVPRAPSPGNGHEDDGYLLILAYHSEIAGFAHRSALHILQAHDLSTVCVALLPHHIPPDFHGSFVPDTACPAGWQA